MGTPNDTDVSAGSRHSWIPVSVPIALLTLAVVWALLGEFQKAARWDTTDQTDDALQARIAALETLGQVAQSPEMRLELAGLYWKLGKRLRNAEGEETARQAAEAFAHAVEYRPELAGGWPYLYIGEQLQESGAKPEKTIAAYERATDVPEPEVAVRAHDALAVLRLSANEAKGYEDAERVSRFGQWSEECLRAVLEGPKSESAAALWCRGLAWRQKKQPTEAERQQAAAFLQRVAQLHPWDIAVHYYLETDPSPTRELDLGKTLPRNGTTPSGALTLSPGRPRRLALYPSAASVLTLDIDGGNVDRATQLEIWLDGEVWETLSVGGEMQRRLPGSIPAGHHILELRVPAGEASTVTLEAARLSPA